MPKTPGETPKRWRTQEIHGATATNRETGELIQLGDISGLVPQQTRRKTARRDIKFVMIDIEAMPKLTMSKNEWKLFWAVVKHTDRERGDSRIQTGELAVELGWISQNTSRTITDLCRRNILIKERVGVLRVNPQLMSRATVARWEVEMETAPDIDWEGQEP